MQSVYGMLRSASTSMRLALERSGRKRPIPEAFDSDGLENIPGLLTAFPGDPEGYVHAAVPSPGDVCTLVKNDSTLSHVHLDGLVVTAQDAIIMVDEKHDIILFNHAAETMFGYQQSDIIGCPLGRLLPSRFQADHHQHVTGFAESGAAARRMGDLDAVAARRADGTEFPAEASISHFKIERQVFYTAIVRDVSERTHAIAELRASEERERAHSQEIRNILFAVPAAVCIAHDRSLSNITENELHTKWFGSATIEGQQHDAHPLRNALERAANGTEVRNYRFSELGRDGSVRHLLGNAIPLWADDLTPSGAVCAFVDVTDLKISESKVLSATKGSADKSDYITNLTHELRTPLSTMLGHAQLLERAKPELRADQLIAIRQILKAGWHLRALINEVQQLSTIEAQAARPKVEHVQLDSMLEDLRAMIAPLLLDKHIAAFFKTEGNVAIKGNLQYCKQVMLNLLSNAIKYNRHGGMIHVSYEADTPDTVRISVRDTGHGLDPDQLTRLFQPFNRLGQEAGREVGTGVGLIVTKRLVETMGGLIGVSSNPGDGTLFWVTLPISKPEDIQ